MDDELRGILDMLAQGQRQINGRLDALVRDVAEKIDALTQTMATKEDLERFATKEDLERFATKEDLDIRLSEFEGRMDARFATLGGEVAEVKEQVTEVRDRIRFLTHKTAELEEDLFVVKRRQRAQ